jgi:hypothetical protein
MKEKFGVITAEDYALHEVPSGKDLRQFIQEDDGGPNNDDLRIDMRGKISSKWNKRVIQILVDAARENMSLGEAWSELPERSNAYMEDIVQDQLERARTVWRDAQPRMLETGEVETLDDVEKRMIERKEVKEKLGRATTRRRSVSFFCLCIPYCV